MKRVGVIDCGTNTFNLLIAERTPTNDLHILYEQKIPVKVGQSSFQTGCIHPEAEARAIAALIQFRALLAQWQVSTYLGFATAAFRMAQNGPEVLQNLEQQSGLTLRMLSGADEAAYIFESVAHYPFYDGYNLVMDIGGGSTECIVVFNGQLQSHWSFNAGATLLLEKLGTSDPLTPANWKALYAEIHTQLDPLTSHYQGIKINTLLGTSGFFDTLADCCAANFTGYPSSSLEFSDVRTEDFNALFLHMKPLNYQQRLQYPGVTAFRAGPIMAGFALTHYVLEQFSIAQLTTTRNSLKEGVARLLTT